MQYYGAGTF
jgi:hypothetical protein